MDDQEAESTLNDIKIFAEGLVVSINEKKYDQSEDYIDKLRKELDKISLYAERKKVAF